MASMESVGQQVPGVGREVSATVRGLDSKHHSECCDWNEGGTKGPVGGQDHSPARERVTSWVRVRVGRSSYSDVTTHRMTTGNLEDCP